MPEKKLLAEYKLDEKTFQRCVKAAKFELEGQPVQQWYDGGGHYIEGYIDLSRLVMTILNEAAK